MSAIAYRVSYWKTVCSSGAAAVAAAGLAVAAHRFEGTFAHFLVGLLIAITVAGISIVLSGLLCLYRDGRQQEGKPDLFYDWSRPAANSGSLRQLYRPLLGGTLRPGDVVRVRGETEILGTLDEQGMLEGLPFMPEMQSYCGREFRVERRVDKINDMITKTGLRRVEHAVTLRHLRCDGTAHDGCQAECQILWKEAWLERVGRSEARESRAERPIEGEAAALTARIVANSRHGVSDADPKPDVRYRCQITEMLKASRPMSPWDVRQDLRAVWFGNVRMRAFAIALSTWLFNIVQRLRGGVDYPWRPIGEAVRTPRADLDLQPGDRVRVKGRADVARTLDASGRNRGMWFDREALRFCGQQFTVRRRVERVVDERSGRMLQLKTPCITLEGVTATGEFLRFCPQDEYIFWREIWLEPMERSGNSGPFAGECSA